MDKKTKMKEKKAGFIELVGKVNFQPSISAALDRAEEVIHSK